MAADFHTDLSRLPIAFRPQPEGCIFQVIVAANTVYMAKDIFTSPSDHFPNSRSETRYWWKA
jgi:hypothetical protein